MRPLQAGVYEVEVLTRPIRLVVVNQLPREEHNALLHLFSASGDLFAYGARHYRIRSAETSSLLLQLLQRYQEEVLTMPDLLEDREAAGGGAGGEAAGGGAGGEAAGGPVSGRNAGGPHSAGPRGTGKTAEG
jgi:hypothetical protein